MPREDLLAWWPLKYKEDRWSVIRFRLKPLTIRNVHSTAKFTNADYVQEVIKVKNMAPEEGFSIVVQKPFVVIGNESPAKVRQRATGTVKWSVDRLKRDYFPEDPDDILAIWLFKDKETYEKYTEEIFGDKPDTPFGYVSYRHKAMIMNIDTGGGTLVHEIVHPFVASNFPECPSWLNEGMGSLYEQCGDYRGRIWGYTNWRLRGLQEVIAEAAQAEKEAAEARAAAARAAAANETTETPAASGPRSADEKEEEEKPKKKPRKLPSFKVLCHTTTHEFYYRDPGTNYAQARYLLYYLQQHGLLRKYYHQFRRNVKQDPSGYATLKEILGLKTDAEMVKFQKDWEAWVMKLRFG
jgi:hypothetical protein